MVLQVINQKGYPIPSTIVKSSLLYGLFKNIHFDPVSGIW